MKRGTQAKLLRYLTSEYGRKPSKQAVSDLFTDKDYRVVLLKNGELDITKTAKLLDETDFGRHGQKIKRKMDAKKGVQKKAPPTKTESVSNPDKLPTQDEVDASPLKETDDRQKIEKYNLFQQYKKNKIANDEKEKELVDFNNTAETVFNFFRSFRDDLLEVGKRTSPTANMSKSKLEAKKIIDEEIHRIIRSKVGDSYDYDEDLKKKIIQILKASLKRQ